MKLNFSTLSAIEELNGLLKKKQDLQKQEILEAIEASPLSHDEIMRFLSGNQNTDEEWVVFEGWELNFLEVKNNALKII